MQRRNSSAQDISIPAHPRLQVPPDNPSAPSSATSSPSRLRASPASERTASMERAPSASVKGFLGRVSSLTSLIAPAPVAKVWCSNMVGLAECKQQSIVSWLLKILTSLVRATEVRGASAGEQTAQASPDNERSKHCRAVFENSRSLRFAKVNPNIRMQKESEDPLGSENTMFYDKELQIWRAKGQPPPEPAAPVGPPPIGPPPTPVDQPASVNSVGPPRIGQPTPASNSGVQSRYVNTLAAQRWGMHLSISLESWPSAICSTKY